MALIQARRDTKLITVDTLQIEAVWTEELDETMYYAQGVSGRVYNLDGDTYRKLLEWFKSNANFL